MHSPKRAIEVARLSSNDEKQAEEGGEKEAKETVNVQLICDTDRYPMTSGGMCAY